MSELVALAFFDRLLALVGVIRQSRKDGETRLDAALTALNAALLPTKAYLVDLRRGGKRDTDKEFQIAKHWSAAAVALRPIDADLAQRCSLKGGYWLEPETWTDERVQASGIAIDKIFEETRALIA